VKKGEANGAQPSPLFIRVRFVVEVIRIREERPEVVGRINTVQSVEGGPFAYRERLLSSMERRHIGHEVFADAGDELAPLLPRRQCGSTRAFAESEAEWLRHHRSRTA
jgi:hypothetical protein